LLYLSLVIAVDLEKVIRIMQGQNTFQFQRYSHIYADANEKSFSIVYQDTDGTEKTLDLIAPSPDIFKLWHDGIKSLITKLQEQRKNYSIDSLFLKSLWDRADADHSGSLNCKEVVSLVQSINVNLPADEVRKLFKKYDIDQSGSLDFSEFIEFMTFLRKRYVFYWYFLLLEKPYNFCSLF
jgi:phosphatidylinositol phospholipase C, delta